jgi:hypothetical protein
VHKLERFPYTLIGQKTYTKFSSLYRDADGRYWEVESDSRGRYAVCEYDDPKAWADDGSYQDALTDRCSRIGIPPDHVSVIGPGGDMEKAEVG